MNIGIIGAGRIGQALTQAAVRSGHSVMLANSRGPDTLQELAAQLQCSAGTVAEAARFGEVVVLSVPLNSLERIDPAVFAGRIVLDTTNYYPGRDGAIPRLDRHETTTSSLVQERLSAEARVVKFFNAIMDIDILADARPRGTPGWRALPIAGDDSEAKRVAAELMDQFGYDPVDAGTLADSWRFERAMPAYCLPFEEAGLRAALVTAQRGVELPHGSWRQKRQAAAPETSRS